MTGAGCWKIGCSAPVFGARVAVGVGGLEGVGWSAPLASGGVCASLEGVGADCSG